MNLKKWVRNVLPFLGYALLLIWAQQVRTVPYWWLLLVAIIAIDFLSWLAGRYSSSEQYSPQ